MVTTQRGQSKKIVVRKEYDTLGALEKLGKYHKLFIERLDVEHSFTFDDAQQMSDAQLMALLARTNGHSNTGHSALSE